MSGIIDRVGSKTGIVGSYVFPDAMPIKIHEWTQGPTDGNGRIGYSITSDSFVTTGIGTSFTTGPNTTKMWIHYEGMAMLYDAGGDLPSGYMRLQYHSSVSASGASPSGDPVGTNYNNDNSERYFGGYNPSVSVQGRHDLYVVIQLSEFVSCNPNSSHIIQLCGKKNSDTNYFYQEPNYQGYVLEFR